MSEIITKINNTIHKYNMLSPGDRVVVGVSGGADSMLLLHYLLSIRDGLRLQIVVANVEHGIRGEESVDDTRFVVDYCNANGVEVQCLTINAPAEAKEQGMGLEEYSRHRRYEFFDSLSPDKIATAHNLSDSVETVLFRLARGTSIKGMSGIRPVRGNIIRPLIDCTGAEIRQYCDAAGIAYRIDSSNADIAYSRNYVRAELVPAFEHLNPAFQHSVARFAVTAAQDDDCLSAIAKEFYDSVVSDRGISVSVAASLHISVLKRVVIMYAAQHGVTLDERHLDSIIALLAKPGRTQLRGDIFAVATGDYLRIADMSGDGASIAVIADRRIVSYQDFLTNCELFKKQFDFYIDCDKIVGDLTLRTRRPGDAISPAGRNCTKSIKKLLNEYSIDVEKRASLPILCDDAGIVAVKDCCVAARVAPGSDTQRVLLLNIRMEDHI